MATPNDIYDEITRIDNAKQGIAEAIEEKGVQVQAETPIQDFPEKVRQIRQGSETAVEYTPQDLTPEQRAQARTNIGATAPEIFFATYGETTAAEVDAAVAAGKVVVCQYNNKFYYFINDDGTQIYFSGAHSTLGSYVRIRRRDNVWSSANPSLQSENQRVTTLSGNETANNRYPTTKAVADALGKWGVVSQTLTWTDSAGQKSTYTISNIVHGIIPQANIDLFVSLGAIFNETSGYFELGDSTDIAYDEMMLIFRHRTPNYSNVQFYGYRLREMLPQGGTQTDIGNCFQSAGRLRFVPDTNIDLSKGGAYPYITVFSTNLFRECKSLRRIEARLYGTTSSVSSNTLFMNCVSLEYVRISNLTRDVRIPDSPLLELQSVVDMVKSAANTTAITITLHADAYARCVADTTEYTYSGQTYTGIIAYAAARNITIASA